MFNRMTILGTGTMGDGIARFFASQKLRVIAYDTDQGKILAARDKLHGEEQLREYLTYTSDLKEAISSADIIIESVSEDLTIKRQLYNDMAGWVKDTAVISSNTSSYPLKLLIANQPFARRMIITHFFNPPDLIPLVEIVQHENAMPGLAEKVADFLRYFGKVPVILKKDIDGFIANRLQAAILREACFLVESGIAGVADIDTVMTESVGMRWAINGPFRISDLGGLDVWQKVCENLLPALSRETGVPEIISKKVEERKLGWKTGQGFYQYDVQDKDVENHRHKLARLLTWKQKD
jgi:3-hydroxybutyryl-CoA dehydrogenase